MAIEIRARIAERAAAAATERADGANEGIEARVEVGEHEFLKGEFGPHRAQVLIVVALVVAVALVVRAPQRHVGGHGKQKQIVLFEPID